MEVLVHDSTLGRWAASRGDLPRMATLGAHMTHFPTSATLSEHIRVFSVIVIVIRAQDEKLSHRLLNRVVAVCGAWHPGVHYAQ